jgi:hypothetical protein
MTKSDWVFAQPGPVPDAGPEKMMQRTNVVVHSQNVERWPDIPPLKGFPTRRRAKSIPPQ